MKIDKFLNNKHPEVDNWVKTHLAGYLKKYDSHDLKLEHHEIEHILDFLNNQFDNNIKLRLSRLSVQDAHSKSSQWITKLNKNAKIKTSESKFDISIIKTYDSGYYWVKLKSSSAYTREGSLMGHCVSSYKGKKDSQIFSLRDKSNQPHCTIEILKNNTLKQIKGKANSSVVNKYSVFILDFLNDFKCLKFDTHDLERNGIIYINQKLYNKRLLPETFISHYSNLNISDSIKLPRTFSLSDLYVKNKVKAENIILNWKIYNLYIINLALKNGTITTTHGIFKNTTLTNVKLVSNNSLTLDECIFKKTLIEVKQLKIRNAKEVQIDETIKCNQLELFNIDTVIFKTDIRLDSLTLGNIKTIIIEKNIQCKDILITNEAELKQEQFHGYVVPEIRNHPRNRGEYEVPTYSASSLSPELKQQLEYINYINFNKINITNKIIINGMSGDFIDFNNITVNVIELQKCDLKKIKNISALAFISDNPIDLENCTFKLKY